MKTVAIIQARMGSTRLPGKVMLPLGEHKVIDWVINRVSRAKLVDEVVLAYPDTLINRKTFDNYTNGMKFSKFKGSEDDVLSRYYHCAKAHDADYIVRITADCPLIDPLYIDNALKFLWTYGDDYKEINAYGHGLNVEVFRMECLALANWLSDEREHVTTIMRAWGDGSSLELVGGEYPRVTLDEQADYDMLCELVKHGDWDTPWLEFAKICEQHKHIPKINAHVRQKEI